MSYETHNEAALRRATEAVASQKRFVRRAEAILKQLQAEEELARMKVEEDGGPMNDGQDVRGINF